MLSYCLKFKEKTENKTLLLKKTKNGGIILSSNYAVCGSKTSRFIKEQGASGLLSSLGIKKPLSEFPIFGPILF